VKPHDGSSTSVEVFMRNPDELCTRFTVENQASMDRVHYAIQDTPGTCEAEARRVGGAAC
jgi:hypothetical protein